MVKILFAILIMISSQSVEQVKDVARIEEVIGKYVNLKKHGAGFTGLCPFHTERTPSFNVTPAKGFYKCFGCGKSGDAISFIMDHDQVAFVDAIKILADQYHITLEHEQDKRTEEAIAEEEAMEKILNAAARKYYEALLDLPVSHAAAIELLVHRNLSPDSIAEWQIGYAPDDWRFLTPVIIERGLWEPASKLGLVKSKNESNYDFFRNRIMMPVKDTSGKVVGFSGRTLSDKKEDAKYLNSPESVKYKKERLLFGLYNAIRPIRDKGYAYLVEGNFDVVTMHDRGITNTVGACGTAVSGHQVKLLKKYTQHVVLLTDPDKAGRSAALHHINIFLQEGFKVEYCKLPDGEDPDAFARKFSNLVITEED